MGYISTMFSSERRPQGTYPGLICRYFIERYFKPDYRTILDVGCGKGIHMREFRELGYDVKGVDRQEAKELSPDLNIETADLECEPLPFPDNNFDVVLCKQLLEHIHNPDNLMGEIHRVLKRGGRLIIELPDYQKHKNFYSDYTHVTPFTLNSVDIILRIHGFKVIEVRRFYQIPFLWKRPWLFFLIPFFRLFPEPEKPLKSHWTKWVWCSRGTNLHGVGEKY